MGRVLTNNTALVYCVETSLGVAATSGWRQLEPNSLDQWGATITTTPRSPISADRQRREGTTTDLDSGVTYVGDVTVDQFLDFIEALVSASFQDGSIVAVPSAVTGGATDSYTVADMGETLANDTLVYGQGFTNSENNGLKLVDGGTATDIQVSTDLADETPSSNALVSECGVQGAAGDVEIDADGNIISTVLDFTTLDLSVGEEIWVGGTTTATKFPKDISDDYNRGYVRITVIAAHKLTIDKASVTFEVDAGVGKTIHLFFGRFLKNVAVTDGKYLDRYIQMEAEWVNLGAAVNEYEYAIGNMLNEMSLNLPVSAKATMNFGFIGTDTETIVAAGSRKTGADSAMEPLRVAAFSTTSDIARMRVQQVDETGLTSDFSNLTLRFRNNGGGEKVLGQLGPKYLNKGLFEVDAEMTVLFTEADVVTAIRANTTVTMDFAIRNADGAVHFDLPSMKLSGGNRDLPTNESVKLNMTGQTFKDPTLDTSIGISVFPYVPAS